MKMEVRRLAGRRCWLAAGAAKHSNELLVYFARDLLLIFLLLRIERTRRALHAIERDLHDPPALLAD